MAILTKIYFLILIIFEIFTNQANQVCAINPEPEKLFPNKVILQQPDLYYLYWKHDNTDITFEVHYKNTSRWIIFGIEQTSSNFYDIVVGWVNDKDETGHFSNHKVTKQGDLTLVKDSPWIILNATNVNDYRILKFKRNIKICDPNSNNLEHRI